MPSLSSDFGSSIGDSIKDSLKSSLHKSGSGKALGQAVASSAKKALLENAEVKFVPAKNDVNSMLDSLKTKYTCLNKGTEQRPAENGFNQASPNTGHAKKHVSTDDGILAPRKVLCQPDKLCMSWLSPKRAGAGLCNLGNTCFLNSVLQCLTYTPPLANFLCSKQHESICRANGFCMLCELQVHISKCLQQSGQAVKPMNILHKLRLIAKHMTWGRQEDAHEFLRYVVEAMQKASLIGHNGLDKRSQETTFTHQVFGGYLRSQVRCLQCRHPSNTYDPFLDLSVDLKNANSLEKALQKFVQPEILDIDNAYKCARCKQKVQAQKQFTIHRPANVLTFHLKRFDYHRMMGGKISRHIDFPQRLNVRPYMSQKNGDPMLYHLYAVLVHSGFSVNSGHYYCYVRAPNQTWYCMNDSSVSQTSASNVLSSEAYILFYAQSKVQSSHKVNGTAPHTATKTANLSNGSNIGHTTTSKFNLLNQPSAKSTFAPASVKPATASPHILKTSDRPRIVMHMKSGTPLTSKPSSSNGLSSSNSPVKPTKLVPYSQRSDDDGDSDDSCNENRQKKTCSQLHNGAASDDRRVAVRSDSNSLDPVQTKSSTTFKTTSGNKISLTTLKTDSAALQVHKTKTVVAVDDRVLMSPPPAKPVGDIQFTPRNQQARKQVTSVRNRSTPVNATTPNWQIADNDGTQSHASGSESNTSINSTSEWKITTNSSPSVSRGCVSPAHGWKVQEKPTELPLLKSGSKSSQNHTSMCAKGSLTTDKCKCSTPVKHKPTNKTEKEKSDTVFNGSSGKDKYRNSDQSDRRKSHGDDRSSHSKKHKSTRSPSPTDRYKKRREDRHSYSKHDSNVLNRSRSHDNSGHHRHSDLHKNCDDDDDERSSHHRDKSEASRRLSHEPNHDRSRDRVEKTHHSRDGSVERHRKHKRHHSESEDSEDQDERKRRKRHSSDSSDRTEELSKSHKKHKKHKKKHKNSGDAEFEWVEVTKEKLKSTGSKDRKEEKSGSFKHSGLNGSSHSKQNGGSGDAPLKKAEHKKRPPLDPIVKVWDSHINDGYKKKDHASGDHKKTGGTSWDGKKESNVGFLLERHSTSHGYGPSVTSWSGGKSEVNVQAEEDAKHAKSTWYDEYEQEMDQGKTKKVKKPKYESNGYKKSNAFQKIQNVTNYMKTHWKHSAPSKKTDR